MLTQAEKPSLAARSHTSSQIFLQASYQFLVTTVATSFINQQPFASSKKCISRSMAHAILPISSFKGMDAETPTGL